MAKKYGTAKKMVRRERMYGEKKVRLERAYGEKDGA